MHDFFSLYRCIPHSFRLLAYPHRYRATVLCIGIHHLLFFPTTVCRTPSGNSSPAARWYLPSRPMLPENRVPSSSTASKSSVARSPARAGFSSSDVSILVRAKACSCCSTCASVGGFRRYSAVRPSSCGSSIAGSTQVGTRTLLSFNQRARDSSSLERTKIPRRIVRFLVGFSIFWGSAHFCTLFAHRRESRVFPCIVCILCIVSVFSILFFRRTAGG